MATQFARRLCSDPHCAGCLARALLLWYQIFGPLGPKFEGNCPDCDRRADESHESGCLIDYTEKALKARGLL